MSWVVLALAGGIVAKDMAGFPDKLTSINLTGTVVKYPNELKIHYGILVLGGLFALALAGAADVILHDGKPSREAMLITQPLEDPLRCVPLLLRALFILLQDAVDNADEGIELGADRRSPPDITRWHRIA